jgi:hypothetical protein
MSKKARSIFKVFMDDHYGPGQRGERGESWRFFVVEQKVQGPPRRAEVLIPVDQELHSGAILEAAKFALSKTLKAAGAKLMLSRAVSCLFTDADADVAACKQYDQKQQEKER